MSTNPRKEPPVLRSATLIRSTPAGQQQAALGRGLGAVPVSPIAEEDPLQLSSPSAAETVIMGGASPEGADGSPVRPEGELIDSECEADDPPPFRDGADDFQSPVAAALAAYRQYGFEEGVYDPLSSEELKAMADAREAENEAKVKVEDVDPAEFEAEEAQREAETQAQRFSTLVAPFLESVKTEIERDRRAAQSEVNTTFATLAQEQQALREQLAAPREQ